MTQFLSHTCSETIQQVTNKIIMACTRSVLSLIYVLIVVATPNAANSKVTSTSNKSGVSLGAHNGRGNYVYNTYNTFCAEPNKKIETLLHEIKNELSKIREEIKYLKENKTTGKGSV